MTGTAGVTGATASATTAAAAGAGAATASPTSGPAPTSSRPSSTARTTRPSSSASGSARAGRRERSRYTSQPSFLERYRTALVVVVALAGVALIAGFVFYSAARPAFACSTIWTPAPTASPAAGATPALGYVQPDQGHTHVGVGDVVTYTYCAPASGNHINKPPSGPIPARVYGPSDTVIPQGWVHNLEHGGMVILYKGDSPGATAEGQAQLRAFYDTFPNSPVCNIPKGAIGPVIARFDQMSTPFQAIVWDRVLPLQTFDQETILAFWQQWGEKTNPEQQCAGPSGSPAASAGPNVSASPAPSVTLSPPSSASPVPSSSAAPSPS